MSEKHKPAAHWCKFNISTIDLNPQILIAWLDHSNIESIEEREDSLEVYLLSDNIEAVKDMLQNQYGIALNNDDITYLENQNWNKSWEVNFNPVLIDDIRIRAPFHESDPDVKTEIILAPKMAFGTGHHETTFMMLRYLNQMNLSNKQILDYGCGTAILSILALIQDASFVQGLTYK